eukprot:TRINITY_DN4119_c0_g1_i1.p1 TRINITY_DN4119_c0_g1~~TRINITY_DN4119_c0_g1_i1.p1  ORF type:complete len:347 (-),score=65.19 TRINITY_DN4119_c0_g1_i1:92-1132(-)
MAAERSIVVSHISPVAEAKHLDEFFAFCGSVESITFTGQTAPDGTKVAVVTFTDSDAVQTALLLSDAIIVDSPIQIAPATSETPAADTGAPGEVGTRAVLPSPPAAAPSQLPSPPSGPAAEQAPKKTAEEVVAGIVIAGYFKGEQIIREVRRRAQEFDEKHHVKAKTTTALSPALDKAKVTAAQLDDKYRLQQKASLASFAFQRALSAGISTVKSIATSNTAPGSAPAHAPAPAAPVATAGLPSVPAAIPTPVRQASAPVAQGTGLVIGADVVAGASGPTVTVVPAGSVAAEAGFHVGDVIRAVAGTATAKPEQLAAALAAIPTGQTTAIEVLRDGSEVHLKVQLS